MTASSSSSCGWRHGGFLLVCLCNGWMFLTRKTHTLHRDRARAAGAAAALSFGRVCRSCVRLPVCGVIGQTLSAFTQDRRVQMRSSTDASERVYPSTGRMKYAAQENLLIYYSTSTSFMRCIEDFYGAFLRGQPKRPKRKQPLPHEGKLTAQHSERQRLAGLLGVAVLAQPRWLGRPHLVSSREHPHTHSVSGKHTHPQRERQAQPPAPRRAPTGSESGG